ncbi:transglycosylase domain-containing protein [Ruminococcus sp. Marseille-P6503]|uniref:transglycosylase domain-containing protein n=1 Tax=Ruminococcus sp. Marseille-P6503 TaxID=2364796 RepID=UPI000F525ADA|nr:transglycosylase domain-containing protein [Ruminococcus sp. Marseille-P6503]
MEEIKKTASKKIKKNKKKTHPAVKALKIFGTLVLSFVLIVIITGSIFVTALTIYVLNFADSDDTVNLDKGVISSNISRFLYKNPDYDENDEDSQEYLLYYALKNQNKKVQWADLEDIPQYVQDAFVYTEDERFYSHDGVDFKRTFAAIIRTLTGMHQGGSTITQQTIKNVTGDNEAYGTAGVERKIREIFRAINVEKTYTKEDILQSYLNIISLNTWEHDIIGVQAAANFYFSKDVSELTLAEAAVLAGMTTSPANYNPYDNPERYKIRQKYCLDHMLENGAISDDEYEQALNEEITVTGDPDFSSATVYEDETKDQGPTSYFMDEAIEEAIDIIADKSGVDTSVAQTRLYNGGYTVYTTVDIDMQNKVEKEMQDASNFQNYYLDDDQLLSGFIAMDYEGNVLAVVGGRNEKTESRIWNNATDAQRSPGSCIKPVASYAPALEQDLMTWSTFFKDEPITIKEEGENVKWPVNYSETGDSENWSYNNYFTWQMLMKSLNTCPAQLIEQMTPAYSYNFLKEKLDFTTLTDSDVNYSPVTVGGLTNGTKLEELVGSYMIFGNGGKKYEVTYISRIEDAEGNVIYEKNEGYKQAISESTAYVMNKMMQTVITQQEGTGRYAKLNNTTVAGKTGTSSEWKDLSFVGCTPDYVSGVWIGYDEQKKIPTNEYQNIGAIWKNIFGDIAEAEENKDFEMPDTVVEAKYCTKTGKLAGNGCSSTATGYYKQTNVPEYCSGGH